MEIYKPLFCCQECYSDISDSVSCKNLECPYCGAVQNLIDTSIRIGVPDPIKHRYCEEIFIRSDTEIRGDLS